MNVTQPGCTATIYQFPKGGRGGSRAGQTAAPAVIRPSRFMPTIVVDSGWYHDDAIREEAQHRADERKPN